MKINGPLSINVLDDDVQAKRTLEIDFTEAFQQLDHAQQISDMQAYIQHLFQNAESLPQGQADREGILLIMQICEQLLPMLQQNELDLAETIALEMGLATLTPEISVSLADFNIN